MLLLRSQLSEPNFCIRCAPYAEGRSEELGLLTLFTQWETIGHQHAGERYEVIHPVGWGKKAISALELICVTQATRPPRPAVRDGKEGGGGEVGVGAYFPDWSIGDGRYSSSINGCTRACLSRQSSTSSTCRPVAAAVSTPSCPIRLA